MYFRLIAILLALLVSATEARAAEPRQARSGPVTVAVARMTHGHVGWILGRAAREDIRVVGIYEPDPAVADRYVRQFRLDRSLIHTDLGRMLDAVKPEAVVAFGAISEHLPVVEAAAPRGIHVMVEKPLAFRAAEAERIAALAKRHRVHVLTNYETTWYPSGIAAWKLVHGEGAVGPIRKIVVRDGHFGPKEIGVQSEFLEWLVDPARNGGGALIDFGCYGANLATWLMKGAAPLTVTAVTQRTKTDPVYSRVDDEATILLTYPNAQAVIQASWNWPDHRKDLQIFGETGYVFTPDGTNVRVRLRGKPETERKTSAADLPPRETDPFAYLAAVVRGTETVADTDRSSLANNVTVVRILDAARQSAKSGRTIRLGR
jgi:predicted dehydrogenase